MRAPHTTWSLSATLSLNFCYKTPHQILLGLGHTVFSNQELCPPWPEKAIKLFTQNSYLQYSIQHWCRGWVFSINMTTDNYTLAHLPSIFLLRDWVLCCCSCWPSTCPEGHSGERMRGMCFSHLTWNHCPSMLFFKYRIWSNVLHKLHKSWNNSYCLDKSFCRLFFLSLCLGWVDLHL